MNLKIFNTLSKKIEPFKPLSDIVKVYACGPTVYNYPHIGNARPAIIGDILIRILRNIFKKVVYVRNITDIDDKINDKAKKEKVSIKIISLKYTKVYQENMRALNVLPPDIEPTVTQNIHSIIKMISTLLEKKHAYEAENHILFHVPSFKDYGNLSKRKKDEMIEGARIEVAPYKKDPMDFVLWKPSTKDQPGWDSPWGRGRPGWHIECSSIIKTYLGETIDIHLGGNDLIFPHHENEIAQSCCAHKTGDLSNFAKYWVHNGFLTIEGEKMSKSLGNVTLAHDLLKEGHDGSALRLAILSSHYRQPLDWTQQRLKDAKKLLNRAQNALENQDVQPKIYEPILKALLDDINTPQAFAELNALIKSETPQDEKDAYLLWSMNILGIKNPDFTNGDDENISEIEALIAERNQAKKDKDFTRSDEIREILSAQGITIKDTREGTVWERT